MTQPEAIKVGQLKGDTSCVPSSQIHLLDVAYPDTFVKRPVGCGYNLN